MATAKLVEKDVSKAKLIEKEGVGEGDVKRQVYMSYLRANGIPMCIAIVILYLVAYGLQSKPCYLPLMAVMSSIWLSIWSADSSPSKSKAGASHHPLSAAPSRPSVSLFLPSFPLSHLVAIPSLFLISHPS